MLTDMNASSLSLGRKLWGFPRFAGDCASGHRRSLAGTTSEQKCDITDSCSQMMLQLHDVYDPNKVNSFKCSFLLLVSCLWLAIECSTLMFIWFSFSFLLGR